MVNVLSVVKSKSCLDYSSVLITKMRAYFYKIQEDTLLIIHWQREKIYQTELFFRSCYFLFQLSGKQETDLVIRNSPLNPLKIPVLRICQVAQAVTASLKTGYWPPAIRLLCFQLLERGTRAAWRWKWSNLHFLLEMSGKSFEKCDVKAGILGCWLLISAAVSLQTFSHCSRKIQYIFSYIYKDCSGKVKHIMLLTKISCFVLVLLLFCCCFNII